RPFEGLPGGPDAAVDELGGGTLRHGAVHDRLPVVGVLSDQCRVRGLQQGRPFDAAPVEVRPRYASLRTCLGGEPAQRCNIRMTGNELFEVADDLVDQLEIRLRAQKERVRAEDSEHRVLELALEQQVQQIRRYLAATLAQAPEG